MGVVYFVILLGIIVVVHELGHLLAAKTFGVYCFEFSIGMGPKLFSKQGKETMWSVRLLPIGGYVAMAGENSAEEQAFSKVDVPFNRTIKGIAHYKRIIIMIAGIVMNLLLALTILSGLLLYQGETYEAPKPIVADVVLASPAERAGFKKDDVIKKVTFADGTVIVPANFYELLNFTQQYDGVMTFEVERNQERLVLELQGEYDSEKQVYLVGLMIPSATVVKTNVLNCVPLATNYLVSTTKTIGVSLLRLTRGIGASEMQGPIGIYKMANEQAQLGITNYLLLIAILSLNVGIMNALPLPALDGGRIVLVLAEWIMRRPLPKKVETALLMSSAVLLMALMGFVMWQDVMRLMK